MDREGVLVPYDRSRGCVSTSTKWSIKGWMSYVMYYISYARYYVSHILVSPFLFHVSRGGCHMSYIMYVMHHVPYVMSYIMYYVSCHVPVGRTRTLR